MNSKPAEQPTLQPGNATTFSPGWLLAACCLASVAIMLQPPLWNLNPPTERPFGAAWSIYDLLASLAGVATVAFLLAGGILGDLYGRRRFLLIGLAGFIGADLLLMVMPALWWFGLSRYIALTFGSLVLPLALASINLVFQGRSRSPALAIFTISTVLATQLAWVQGAYFVTTFGWRAPYVLPILVAAATIALILRRTPETVASHHRMVDTVVYMGWTLMVLAALYGLMALPVAAGHGLIIVGVTLVVGMIGATLVFWWNRRTSGGQHRSRRVRTLDLTALLVTGVLLQFVMIGYGLRTLTFFQVVQGRSTLGALLAMAPMLVGALAALYLILRALHRRQARVVIAGGLLTMGVAIALTALWPPQAPYLFFALSLAAFGAGYLLATTVWMNAFLRTAIDGYYGLNAGISKAASLTGGALGAVVTGSLLATIGSATYSELLIQEQGSATASADALAAFNTMVTANPAAVQTTIAAAQPLLLAGYLEAYAVAYDSVLWLLAGLCTLAALIIVLGLRRSVRAARTDASPTQEALPDAESVAQPLPSPD